MVKNLPTIQETWIRSLGQDGPLEKRMDTHSSIFAWRIPWTEKPGGLQSHGITKNQTWLTNTHTHMTRKDKMVSFYIIYIILYIKANKSFPLHFLASTEHVSLRSMGSCFPIRWRKLQNLLLHAKLSEPCFIVFNSCEIGNWVIHC